VRERGRISNPLLLLILLVAAFSTHLAVAQETVIKGKVTDANSGDPIPYVNVVFIGTSIGATTDFDGNYLIKTSNPGDTLIVSYIGYKPKKKAAVKGISQIINIQIEEDVTSLQEVVIHAGENPAFEVLRRVNRNKYRNDKRKFSAYEYDTYTKIEIDVDNISDKFKQKKIVKKITAVLDSIDRIAGEDGKPILPMLITESTSRIYYRDNPSLKYEHINKSKINGVGVEDGTMVTQLIGSSFQEYNFYQNWLNIVTKDFVSPIADGARLYYEYDLTDSLYVGEHYCYRLDFFPKSPQDLAFTGTMWITKNEYALKQIDASIGRQANLNFIEKIRIQQELAPANAQDAWLPVKNRVLIDVSEIAAGKPGMLAKFYTSNRNFTVNKPHEPSFYSHPIRMAEDARLNEDETAWDSLRHEPLSETEKNVYKMIDTLQNIPIVRTYIDIIKIAVEGYYTVGKIDIGPYPSMLAVNNLEGVRIQPGFKTNIKFSDKWVIGGQFGYGFKDERIKYYGYIKNILSRDRWTTLTVSARSDLGRVGLDPESAQDNVLLAAAQRYGTFRRGYYLEEDRIDFKREFFKGFSQRIGFRYSTFEPTFEFAYYQEPGDPTSAVKQNYETAELILESRYAKDELFIQSDNDRYSMGTEKWPVITMRFTKGFKGFGGSDFEYEKLRLSLYKRVKFGPLGHAYVTLSGEYIFNTLPYTLLSLHLGNQTFLYTPVTYNLMNYGEFVSDRFASLQYQHHFEGFLLNRIPLMRKLKWRLVGSANVIYGGLRSENEYTSMPETIPSDPAVNTLEYTSFENGKPYVELGYGVENIFKFVRVDFVHRLNYLNLPTLEDTPKVRNFGVFVSFQFSL